MAIQLFSEAKTVQNQFRFLPGDSTSQHDFFNHAVRKELTVYVLHDEIAAPRPFLIRQIGSVKGHTATGRNHAAERFRQCGLSAAVVPDHSDNAMLRKTHAIDVQDLMVTPVTAQVHSFKRRLTTVP